MSSGLAVRVSEIETAELEPTVEGYTEEPQEISEYFERFDELCEALKELDEIKGDCSQPNWEGNDELPVTTETIGKARKLLFHAVRLQNTIDMPYVTAMASGWIELEWYKERGYRFAVRLNGRGVFIFSGLFGKETDEGGNDVEAEAYGQGTFLKDTLPGKIKSNLHRLFDI